MRLLVLYANLSFTALYSKYTNQHAFGYPSPHFMALFVNGYPILLTNSVQKIPGRSRISFKKRKEVSVSSTTLIININP